MFVLRSMDRWWELWKQTEDFSLFWENCFILKTIFTSQSTSWLIESKDKVDKNLYVYFWTFLELLVTNTFCTHDFFSKLLVISSVHMFKKQFFDKYRLKKKKSLIIYVTKKVTSARMSRKNKLHPLLLHQKPPLTIELLLELHNFPSKSMNQNSHKISIILNKQINYIKYNFLKMLLLF